MSGKPYILTDFRINDPASEYFSLKDVDLDFLPEDTGGVPLVDVINHKTAGKSDVTLILSLEPFTDRHHDKINALPRLYKEKTVYESFTEVRKRMRLVFYNAGDRLIVLDKIWKYSPEIADWFNNLHPFVWADGIAGKLLKEKYNGCEFITVNYPPIFNFDIAHFGTLKRHSPKKEFLCMMAMKHNRSFRSLLHDDLVAKGLTKHMIYKFKTNKEISFQELSEDYPATLLQSAKGGPMCLYPPIQYYNQTNLELGTEAFASDGDDTFDVSEKTIRPIAMRHPFMMLANMRFLENLRRLGFQTFGDHIDESYDLEPVLSRRIDMITNNLELMVGKSHKLYTDTREVRDHNLSILHQYVGKWKTSFWKALDEFFKNV